MNLLNLTRALELEASFTLLRPSPYLEIAARQRARKAFMLTRVDDERALHYWNTGRRDYSPDRED